MSNTWKAALAVTTLVGTATLSSAPVATASASGAQHRARPAAATSLALVPLVGDSAALTSAVTARAKASATIKADVATGTAISPDGNFALVCNSGAGSVISVTAARTRPSSSHSLVLSRFRGEGGAAYHWFPRGVSFVGGSRYAVVTGNGQGVVQLVRSARGWAVDARVHSPGVNAAGHAHQAGLLAIPDTTSGATLYDGIAVSPVPAARGKYLGVAVDRTDGTLAVLSHLGTGHPRVESTLASPLLENRAGADDGNGGVAFSPVAPTRVAVQTTTGLAVLDLSDPAHPVLQSPTTTPGQPQSIAVAPHGNRVLVGSGNHLYLYSGLLVAGPSSPLTLVATVTTPDRSTHSPEVSSIAYLASGSAVVVHGDDTNRYARQTLLRHAELSSATWGSTHVLKSPPDVDNALSVWPGLSQTIVAPHLKKRMKVHQRVSSKLTVRPAGSLYAFTVASGKLPPHLRLHHGRITGRVTRAGHFSFAVRAQNPYGAVVTRHFSIHVGGRR